MQKIDTLKQKVETLYMANHPGADVWIDWAYPNHVLWVAHLTEEIAIAQQARVELAVAGALVHDIADTVTSRKDPEHAAKSLALATELLRGSGFTAKEVSFIIGEVVKPHGCNDQLPTTLEGKSMATADGAAHFLTDFYPLFCWRHYGPEDDYETFKAWMLAKMDKHYHKKLFFDDIRQRVQPRYEALRMVFHGL